jgi:2-oxoglutarate dehydrogenase E2 component (dihydrolipoamide succinyltransferase)
LTELRVPKLNNNDTEYQLVEWLVDDGATVVKGDPLVVVETSKAAEELVAECDGVLAQTLPAGRACAPGDLIARVADPSAPPVADPEPVATGDSPPEPVITAPAQALIDEHGVDPVRVRALGVTLVRRADIEALLATGTGPTATEPATEPAIEPTAEPVAEPVDAQQLPPVQRAVAAAVARSHREIPAAFTAVTLDVGAAMKRARELTKQARALIGLTELLVAAVAAQHEHFPMFFAQPVTRPATGTDRPGETVGVRPAEAPHIGVTVDVGGGLYVPVLHDAHRLSLKEIAQRLTDLRATAMRGSFREADLTGGNIVITLHTDAAVTLAVPIVFPGQACALSLTAPRHEPAFDKSGNITKRTVVSLGLAFDHRIVNGRDAALFLTALQQAIAS